MITRIEDTGGTINNNPRVKLTLQVQPDRDLPFEVTKKATVPRVSITTTTAGGSTVIDARNVPGLRAPSALGGGAPSPAPAEDPLDQLSKLNDLRKSGVLTEAEFAAQKAKILGET